jgi:hypothetical protein
MDTTDSVRGYELSLLGWEVIEPINGRTDHYVVAAFEYAADAAEYTEWRNLTRDPMNFPLEVRQIGTAHHPVV